MAGLLKYFRHESKQKLPVLPDLKGSLSKKVPSSLIELTNDIVHEIIDKKTMPPCGKCGEYCTSLTDEYRTYGRYHMANYNGSFFDSYSR